MDLCCGDIAQSGGHISQLLARNRASACEWGCHMLNLSTAEASGIAAIKPHLSACRRGHVTLLSFTLSRASQQHESLVATNLTLVSYSVACRAMAGTSPLHSQVTSPARGSQSTPPLMGSWTQASCSCTALLALLKPRTGAPPFLVWLRLWAPRVSPSANNLSCTASCHAA